MLSAADFTIITDLETNECEHLIEIRLTGFKKGVILNVSGRSHCFGEKSDNGSVRMVLLLSC